MTVDYGNVEKGCGVTFDVWTKSETGSLLGIIIIGYERLIFWF